MTSGPVRNVAVAVSGGQDSTALLHVTCRFAAQQGLWVHALHVHHGLLREADGWVTHLRNQVRRWSARGLPVQLHVRHLDGAPSRGQSVEAWAREGRYAALAAMARAAACDLVLLAQHRRDQAETFMLQALRGGGARGLASMPRQAQRDGLLWCRPWLDQPREAVLVYVRRHRLSHVVDPSNNDLRLGRGRLRAMAMGGLIEAFPEAEAGLAGAARRAAVESAALDEWVGEALPRVVQQGCLAVAAWSLHSPARRQLLLRAWLRSVNAPGTAQSLIDRLADELPRARSGRWPFHSFELRLHRGSLYVHQLAVPEAMPGPVMAIDLSLPGEHEVRDWGGWFSVTPSVDGFDARDLRVAQLRPRLGGERFRLAAGRPARSLKKQFQARRVDAFARDGPLLFIRGQLAFVPGLGMEGSWVRAANDAHETSRLAVVWHREPGPGTTINSRV